MLDTGWTHVLTEEVNIIPKRSNHQPAGLRLQSRPSSTPFLNESHKPTADIRQHSGYMEQASNPG
jgi:hypothetical protein